MTDDEIRAYLRPIRQIREANNDPWLELVFLAVKHAPVEAAKCLHEIAGNDAMVKRWTQRMADDIEGTPV